MQYEKEEPRFCRVCGRVTRQSGSVIETPQSNGMRGPVPETVWTCLEGSELHLP
jgi:hypothetical protein